MRLTVLASLALAALAVGPLAVRARAEDAPEKPADDAEKAKKERNEKRGYVGLVFGIAQKFTAEERKEAGIKVEKGLVVVSVVADGPADKAGVTVGDVPISMAGFVFPDAKDVPTGDEDKAFSKWMDEKVSVALSKIDPGQDVEIVVERDGKRLTFHALTMDHKSYEALVDEAARDRWVTKVPKPVDRGPATAATLDFEKVPDGEERPADVLSLTGYWQVVPDETKEGNHVLAQGTEEEVCVALVVADGRVYGDATAKVRFLLKSGERSASAGIVVRAIDRKNYYALRIDGVAQNLVVVKVEHGIAKTIATSAMKSPKLGAWHTLEVKAAGPSLSATFDGSTSVAVEDKAYAAGWWGLVTMADAVTWFDDLTFTPAAAK